MPSEIQMRILPIDGEVGRSDLVRPDQPGGPSFVDAIGRAINEVDRLQLEADTQVNQVSLGGGNIHEMSIALEKADVALRLAMKVRGKIMDTYNEIMRMGL